MKTIVSNLILYCFIWIFALLTKLGKTPWTYFHPRFYIWKKWTTCIFCKIVGFAMQKRFENCITEDLEKFGQKVTKKYSKPKPKSFLLLLQIWREGHRLMWFIFQFRDHCECEGANRVIKNEMINGELWLAKRFIFLHCEESEWLWRFSVVYDPSENDWLLLKIKVPKLKSFRILL